MLYLAVLGLLNVFFNRLSAFMLPPESLKQPCIELWDLSFDDLGTPLGITSLSRWQRWLEDGLGILGGRYNVYTGDHDAFLE